MNFSFYSNDPVVFPLRPPSRQIQVFFFFFSPSPFPKDSKEQNHQCGAHSVKLFQIGESNEHCRLRGLLWGFRLKVLLMDF